MDQGRIPKVGERVTVEPEGKPLAVGTVSLYVKAKPGTVEYVRHSVWDGRQYARANAVATENRPVTLVVLRAPNGAEDQIPFYADNGGTWRNVERKMTLRFPT